MRNASTKIWMLAALLGGVASPCLAQDPCRFLTKAEIADLAGFQVDTAAAQTFPGSTACVYGAKTHGSVQVRTYAGKAAVGTEAMCRSGQPVSGIGDRACIVSRGPATTLVAMKGGSALMVVVFYPSKPDPNEEVQSLARKAFARM
jgi:hypothetical protein